VVPIRPRKDIEELAGKSLEVCRDPARDGSEWSRFASCRSRELFAISYGCRVATRSQTQSWQEF
jgi:hypothetical protein